MIIKTEQLRAARVLSVLQQLIGEDAVVTKLSLSNPFSIRALCRVNIVTIVTDTDWTLSLVMEEAGVSFIKSAIGPDGEEYLSKHPIAVFDDLSGPEKADFDAVIQQAITATLPK